MTLDITQIPSQARAALIKDGERHGSSDTLEQANRTLNAFDLHGPKLAAYGFAPEDATELKDARDALVAAGVDRDSKRHGKRIDTAAYQATMTEGFQVRLRARAIAVGAKRVLLRAAKIDAIHKIDSLLGHETQAADNAEDLAKQLDRLRSLFSDPDIEDASKTRGGPQTVIDLQDVATRLRAVTESKAEPKGTPVETETLDLIDGIILSLVRTARNSAKAAARALGEPALETAFELSALYKRRGKNAASPPQVTPLTPEAAPAP